MAVATKKVPNYEVFESKTFTMDRFQSTVYLLRVFERYVTAYTEPDGYSEEEIFNNKADAQAAYNKMITELPTLGWKVNQ